MLAKLLCAAVRGVDAVLVQIEADVRKGPETTTVVGLPDAAVKESRDRVRAAVQNSGFEFPKGKITVNLAPAYFKKEGVAFDLPLALGILIATGQAKSAGAKNYVFMGELSLDGSLRKIKGALPAALFVEKSNAGGIVLPADNAPEACAASGANIIPVKSLTETVKFLNGEYRPVKPALLNDRWWDEVPSYRIDFSEIAGQEHAKRGLEVASAGGHNIVTT